MDLSKLMQQAQQMQAGMQQKQAKLEAEVIEGSSANGKIKVKANGAAEVLEIKIDPSIVDPDDVEFLEELVLAGVQDALNRVKERTADEMKSITGGLDIGNILG
jgi:hypothetical protein